MRSVVLIALLSLLAMPCGAGLFKNSVDLADLAEAPAEALVELEETEFAAFVAQVRLSSARAAERRAVGATKAADRLLDTELLDLKAAKAEVKAARANRDGERLAAAEAMLKSAERDHRIGKRFLEWKQHERETREAEEKAAAAGLDLAEARRDLARVELLARHRVPAAGQYDLSDLAQAVRKRQAEHESASRKASAKAAELEKLHQEWLRLAGGRG